MHDETDIPGPKSMPDPTASADRKIRAATFGLGVAALAGLVAATGPAGTQAGAPAADHVQPAAIAMQFFDGSHLTCSQPT